MRTGLEPHRALRSLRGATPPAGMKAELVARRGGQWGGHLSDHTDESCSRWKGRCDQGQQTGPGWEPLESEQSGSRTGLL